MQKPYAYVALTFAFVGCQCSSTTPTPSTTSSATPSATASNVARIEPTLPVDRIDERIRALWAKAGVEAAPTVDDARFLRRVTLDLTGNLPTIDEVTAFAADTSASKRDKAVERLLASTGYAEHWTDVWDHLLLGNDFKAKEVDRVAFRRWLYPKFKQNTPWDQVATELITATGTNSTGDRKPREMLVQAAQDVGESPPDPGVNGAVNWYVRHNGMPADLSGAASRLFLGVQIQCAQCHDHKTEAWKQEDFRKFTACFTSIKETPLGDKKDPEIDKVDLEDSERPKKPGKKAMNVSEMQAYLEAAPAALDGTAMPADATRRKAFASWLTAPNNPYFAKAFVNRMWSQLLGRGFVEPVDDFRPGNAAVAPEVLDLLAKDFIDNKYDVKRLMRIIASTEAYERAAMPLKKGDAHAAPWARYPLKDLDPEVLLDSLITATHMGPSMEQSAGGKAAEMRFNLQRQFRFVFEVDEDGDDDDYEGTITQALMLLNGSVTNNGVRGQPTTALAEVMAMPGGDEDKIRSLYLRTLSRQPRPEELTRWVAFVNEPREAAKDTPATEAGPPSPFTKPGEMAERKKEKKAMKKDPMAGPDPLASAGKKLAGGPAGNARHQAYEDIFWALLNSSEFIFNH